MSSLSRFRLITFAMTDTLIKFRTAPGKLYGEIGALFGVSHNEHHDLVAKFKINWHHMNTTHPIFGQKSNIDEKEWWRLLIKGTFDHHNLSDEKINNMTNYLLDIYKTSSCWVVTFGAVDFLKYLNTQKFHDNRTKNSEQQLNLGVISNFDSRLEVLMKNMKLNEYFDFSLGSYQAGFEKPSREIFSKAMKLSGIQDLKPYECLHIGNTPITDYLGAKNAGWSSILVHDKMANQLREKYGEIIETNHVYNNLLDLHKSIVDNRIQW
ncbi:unnamed protein product [Chironomus riparius]|uniref:Reg-2-like protein n=1 Tax=Chironomus riparius TaxID=315576 RepID=A0A9N9RTN3_9DIPT|nr:unnamed protein product [Chironomus riparius]